MKRTSSYVVSGWIAVPSLFSSGILGTKKIQSQNDRKISISSSSTRQDYLCGSGKWGLHVTHLASSEWKIRSEEEIIPFTPTGRPDPRGPRASTVPNSWGHFHSFPRPCVAHLRFFSATRASDTVLKPFRFPHIGILYEIASA